MKAPYKLAALLIVALIFSTGECAASCAFASCNPADAASTMPPCHGDSQRPNHQSPAPCGHELQLLGPNASSISQSSVSSLLITTEPIPAVFASQPDVIAGTPHVPSLLPPRLRADTLLVLRI